MDLKPFDGELDKPSSALTPFNGTLDGEKPKGSGVIRKAGDLAAGFVSGALGATKALTDAAGAGNAASNFLDAATKDVDSLLSPQAKADRQEQSAILKEAQGKGAYEGIKAGFKAFGVAPVQTTVGGLGSVLPVAAATLATGGGAVPAIVAGAATGMAMGAGTAKGSIYDDIKQRGLDSGMTPAAAEAAATQAQSYGGGNTDQIAVGAGLGALDAATGVTPIVANLARKAAGREAVKALTTNTGHGILRRTATGALEEMPLEAAQGGQEQLATNIAAQRAGYQAGTWDNVASNATLEGLASAGPGAAFGAMSGGPKPAALTPPAVSPPAESVAPQLGFNPQVGTHTVFPDGSVLLNSETDTGEQAVFDKRFAPQPAKPSEVMGLDPSVGPMSAAAALAVDSGAHQALGESLTGVDSSTLLQRSASGNNPLQEAMRANQAEAEPTIPLDAASEADRRAYEDAFDKPAPPAYMGLPSDARKAILYGNKEVNDGGKQFEGTQDGDILNGLSTPFKTRFAAARRAHMMGNEWAIAPVTDGFVARWKGPSNAQEAIQSVPLLDPAVPQAGQGVQRQPGVDDGSVPAVGVNQSGQRSTGSRSGVLPGAVATPAKPSTQAAPAPPEISKIDQLGPDNAVSAQAGPEASGAASAAPGLPAVGTTAAQADGVKSGDWIKLTEGTDQRPRQIDSVGPDGWVYTKSGDSLKPGQFTASDAPVTKPGGEFEKSSTTNDSVKEFIAGHTGLFIRKPGQQHVMRDDAPEAKKAEFGALKAAQSTQGQGSTPDAPAPANAGTQVSPALGVLAAPQSNEQVAATQIPDMTDTELAQMQVHYGPDHKRTPKIIKEMNRRALAVRLKPGAATIDDAAHQAATSRQNDLAQPTDGQKAAGNYAKGHVMLGGLDLSIENPAGSVRSGTDRDGKAWSNTLQSHYGYIKGTMGNDKDHVDLFVKPGTPLDFSGEVYVIDQVHPDTRKFDEHKVMAGFSSEVEATAAYHANYAKGWKGMKAVTPMAYSDFKTWVKDGPKNTPLAKDGTAPIAPFPSVQPQGVIREPQADQTQQAEAQRPPEPAAEPVAIPDAVKKASHEAAKKLWENPEFAKRPDATIYAAGWTIGYDGKTPTGLLAKNPHFIEGHAAGVKAAAPAAGAPLPNATAPEHVAGAEGEGGVSVEEMRQIATAIRGHVDSGGDAEVTHILDAPGKGEVVRLADKAKIYHKEHGWMTPAQAKTEIAKWKENARKQGETRDNAQKVVLSLFDLSGEWSKPWEEAGYNVFRFDIQDDPVAGDVNNFSTEFFSDWFGDFDGQDIYAILAATPCTDFASSGARHFAAKDEDGRTVASIRLVKQTMAAIEYFRPAVWALENPVGRIESLTGIPPWRLSFDPNQLGDPYTKKTLIWGRFNGDLPIAPVEPTEGSKMHSQYGGKSQATKNARSVTPEGFAYGFFQANNAIDNPVMAISNKYDRLDKGAIKAAVGVGLTDKQIDAIIEDFYYQDLDDDAANAALLKAAAKGADGLGGNEYGSPNTPLRFISGMSAPADFGALLAGDKNVGITIGNLSNVSMPAIAQAMVDSKGSHLFVDSGAFSIFMANLKAKGRNAVLAEIGPLFAEAQEDMKGLDFDAILDKYDKLLRAIGVADGGGDSVSSRVFLVMPDIVGDQAGSLELVKAHAGDINGWPRAIVPLQGGKLSLKAAYEVMMANLGLKLDDISPIIGIPSKAAAVSNAEFKELLDAYGDNIKGIHILGAFAAKTLGPRIDQMRLAGYDGDVSADANRLRSLMWGDTTRAEAMRKLLAEGGEGAKATNTDGAKAFAAGQPRELPHSITSVVKKREWLADWDAAAKAAELADLGDAPDTTVDSAPEPDAPAAPVETDSAKIWDALSFFDRHATLLDMGIDNATAMSVPKKWADVSPEIKAGFIALKGGKTTGIPGSPNPQAESPSVPGRARDDWADSGPVKAHDYAMAIGASSMVGMAQHSVPEHLMNTNTSATSLTARDGFSPQELEGFQLDSTNQLLPIVKAQDAQFERDLAAQGKGQFEPMLKNLSTYAYHPVRVKKIMAIYRSVGGSQARQGARLMDTADLSYQHGRFMEIGQKLRVATASKAAFNRAYPPNYGPLKPDEKASIGARFTKIGVAGSGFPLGPVRAADILREIGYTEVDTKAVAAAAKAGAKAARIAARELDLSLFNALSADVSMLGKTLDQITVAINVRAGAEAGAPTGDRLTTLAKSIHKTLASNAKELAKQANRDLAVYKEAVDSAIAAANVEGVDASARFQAGWAHALAGKTKSTLVGDNLTDQLKGYEGAREWMKTKAGKAWFDGVPMAKLQNTGVDLRRHWELMKAEMKANESDAKKAWAQIERATTRSDLFAPFLTAQSLPGFVKYVTEFRSNVMPFKKWLDDRATAWWGDKSYSSRHGKSEKSDLEYMLEGSRGPTTLVKEDRQKYKDDESYRISVLQDFASQYLAKVKEVTAFLDGATNVTEAAKAFDMAYVKPEHHGVKDGQIYNVLNESGEQIRMSYRSSGSGVWENNGNPSFQSFRTDSGWTQTLVEKEATLELPKRADQMVPPKLDRVTREGMTDQRKGANVTPDEAKALFGFADVGFGEYVASKQDQDHLNYAHDAFMDLANHFGTSPKNIGFGGQMHFTIGALGHGKFSAHFHPAHPTATGRVQVINLTNTKGDGAVYHEWIHALDHFLTGEWKRPPGGGRPSVRDRLLKFLKFSVMTPESVDKVAKKFLVGGSGWTHSKGMTKVDSAIRGIQYYGDTADGQTAFKVNADKLGKDYWGNNEELIARAAEAWAVDTLKGTNTYLVNPAWAGDGKVTPASGFRGTPYPSGGERILFAKAFDALAKATQWVDGKPTITLADFEAALPPDFSAAKVRRDFLAKPENMQAFYEDLLVTEGVKKDERDARLKAIEEENRLERERATAAEKEAMDKLAADKLAELEPAIVDGPAPSEAMGPLSDAEIEAIFDQAAAQVRERDQEKPEVAPPGVEASESTATNKPTGVFAQWPQADLEELLAKANNADMIAISGGEPIWNVPDIHELGRMGTTTFLGDGMFETKGTDSAGKPWSMMWDGGGAMKRTAGGKAWTNVGLSGNTPYPSGVRRAIEAAIDAKAAERRAAAAKVPAVLPPALAAQAAAKSPKVDATPAAEDPTATALIAKAAKLGVSGIDDALKGLSALFGGPGRLNSFPGGFDADTYAKAKPFFESSLKKFQESGKTLLDLFDMLIEALGMGIKPYAMQFAKDQKLQANLAADQSPSIKIAEKVQQRLAMGHSFDWRVLFGWADEAFGGTQGEGKYAPKDAYDALEAGVNRYLMADQGRSFNPNTDREGALLTIAALERVTALLPTQTKRTAEQDEFQQFSTVPALAFAANWVANITAGDLMLEPSAGIGGLAVFAKNAGAKLVLNELSARRAALLQSVFPASTVMTENAEQINNTLPDELAPTVVVMNPPFSASAGRMEGKKDTMVGALHVEQALKRMVPGARLVAIVGEGMGMDRPAFAAWWKRISAEYDVRAVIPMDGAGYAKYGTTYDNAILVIDKVKPVAGRKVVTTKAMTYTELVGLLSEIRNDRPVAQGISDAREGTERDAAESALGAPAGDGRGTVPYDQLDGVLGDGKPAGQTQQEPGGNRRGDSSLGDGRPTGSVRPPGRTGSGKGGNTGAGRGNNAGDPQRDIPASVDQRRQPGTVKDSGVTIGVGNAATAELTESVFESYQPQRLSVAGAKPHPGPLVQSAAMASVLPPAPTYTPNLPKETITKGLLSIAQIEAVVYAGQSHDQDLELKSTPETIHSMKLDTAGVLPDAAYRRGFFIGDGTGVGKGREISGILLDNLRQGRKKHVWISEKQGLINDAARDFAGVQDGAAAGDILKSGQIFNLSKRTEAGTWKVNADNGILYTTYSTLRSAQKFGNFDKGDDVELTDGRSGRLEKISENKQSVSVKLEGSEKAISVPFSDVEAIDGDAQWSTTLGKKAPAGFKPRSRLDQIVEWLGPDFDGVIAFDEAHNAGNAVGQKGKMGTTEASAQAEAVVELQNRLPRARVVYVSATGATEVSNFAFANRLGLWGPGTAFASLSNFIAEMVSGGLATMELVARDMKQMGAYIARSLSFDGVSYSRLEHQLSDMQNDQYNRMADAWQVTLRNMTKAMEITGAAGSNGEKKKNDVKKNMKSAFWGAQQRFFNQIITAMQMPTVLDSIDADLKAGHAIVLQLVNTNEAAQEKALGEKKEKGEEDLEDLDMTPRQMLMQMVTKAFPVTQYEDFTDSEGKKGSRKALDSEGKEIENREAVAMRDALLKDLEQIKVPAGPLEILINHFGPEITAEITGRKQRVVNGRWNKAHKGGGSAPTFIQKRGAAAARADADAFMADKKRILIFSDAGGTGFSFHADKTQANQRQRKHYLIQPGWRANKAVQGLGRTHRTNQKSAPEYVLVATDIPAHKRFLSSIARRLDQLGALTKGQRDTSSGGLFTEKDNLESKYAQQAARQLILDIQRGQVEGVIFREFMHQMGLEDIINPQTNQIADDKFPPPSQFLNRLLSLTIPMQNKVFAAFISRMEEKIDVAAQRGELDTGMQTIRAIETNILNEDVIYTDPRTGAETSYIELDSKQPNRFYTFPSEKTQGAKIRWAMNKKSGRVWAIVKSGTITKRDGAVVDKYRALGTGGTQVKEGSEFQADSWKEITEDEARVLWDDENQVRPQTYNEKVHLISGVMLPIWDRLKTDGAIQVARTQTSDGRRLLGRVINQKDVADIRKRMNIASPASKLTIPEVMARILKGDTAELANGWKLARARVSDDLRIEVDAGYLTPAAARELLALGAMHERIQWKDRYFIPTGNAGIPVLDALFKNKPIVDLFDPNAAVPDDTAAMSRAHSARKFSPIARIQATKAVEATAKVLQDAMVNGPKVVVAFDMGDPVVPDAVRKADDKQRSGGAKGAPEGFYHRGTVYLMASKLTSPADVARVYAHEVLGHHGLRGMFGGALKPILQQIATMRRAQVDAKIKEYGLRGVSNLDRLTAAEEVLAEMAQTMPEIGFVQRAIAAIRTWLRANVPGFKDLALTDAEIIRSYILPARGWVERGPDGNGPKDGLPAFSRGAKYADGPDQRFTRPWYDRLISLLPESYRNDPHRREPLPAEGWDVYRTREIQGKVDALNRELRGPKDTKGYGPVNVDLLGNLQVDARDAAIGDVLRGIKALADELAYGVVVTGVKTDDIRMLRGAGFESEISLAAVADRLTGVREKTAENTASVRAPGTIMSYQPRGFPLALFSRSKTVDGARAAVVTNLKTYAHKAGNRLADFRGLALGSMGRRQLVDVYGDILPLDRYNTLVQQMDADKNEAGAEADTLADTWGKLNATTQRPNEDRHVAEMMHDATLAQIDPDKPLQPGDDPDVHQELAWRFNALSAEGKAIYRQARTMYAEHFDKVKDAIRERIQRSEMTDGKKAALMEKMDAQFFGAVKGVYFPLQRFGQYTVLVRNAEGDVQSVNRAETLNEAEETRRILLRAFPAAGGFVVGKVLKAKEFNSTNESAGRGFMKELFDVLDKQGVSEDVQDSINQLYLASLPDLSWAKHGIHRKGTPGFSQDARRAFAQNMFHGARYLAKIRYSDQLQTELEGMQEHVDSWTAVEDVDSVKAQQVVDEFNKRHELLMNPESNPISTALTSLGFVFHLGLSPASALVNLTQTAMVAYPIMGAKWGFDKASSTLFQASKEAAANRNDISKILSGDEKRAYDQAVRSGVIDVTQAHDLAGISQGEDAKVTWKLRPVMKAASFLFHHAEKFNRQVTFVAAYRLAKAAGAGHEVAYEQAVNATYGGHFDYSASNRPRYMQGNVARVVLLFKQYAQNMIFTLGREAQLSITGTAAEKKEARRALAGLLTAHALAAGAFGLPLVGTLLALASMLGGDDDEPWDAKTALQNMLAVSLGQKPAEVIAHGLSRLTPWDISGRVGLDKLLLPDIQEGLQGSSAVEAWMTSALGAVAGIAVNAGKGMAEISEGRWVRGLEAMMPTALRGPLKAYRYATEGNIDKTGIAINEEVGAAGVAGQALGFSPSETRLAQEGRSAIYQADKAIMARRTHLLHQFGTAAMANDEELKADAREAIQRFNERNPKVRINPMQMMQSVRNRMKRVREADDGVYLPKGRRDAMEAGRFAQVELI